ncbi:sigma-70 family RNA polymerase sigma factor [Saccharicrinis aurantiacus]|uniref:sigma-70 family RNA polymerase sigma factor n=1 Tax=Saccharicrinis aurantiacus TaxID=1849719 RepID=UPI0008387ADF|nr:sigma-70 family RNA polymerase sigma factor [Saccharicrinis aurantiacus]
MKENNLEIWVNQYTEDLYRWALHKTSSQQVAEDLVQETFLAAAEKIDSFRGDSTPKTWLFSILNFKVIDYYRSKSKKDITLENEALAHFFDQDGEWKQNVNIGIWDADDANLLDNTDFRTTLEHCIEALPPKWQSCVKLKYLSEKKGEEICQELGIAPTNLWQMIHRAKLQLRGCLHTNWFKH